MMEELESTERKILRKISAPGKDGEEYRKHHDNELFSLTEKITDASNKKKIGKVFCGHLQ